MLRLLALDDHSSHKAASVPLISTLSQMILHLLMIKQPARRVFEEGLEWEKLGVRDTKSDF